MAVTEIDLKTLAATNRASRQALQEYQERAGGLGRQHHLTLAGLAGGLGGLCLAWGLAQALQLPALVLSILLCACGVIIAVLLQMHSLRGHRATMLEQNREQLQEVLARIRTLPKSTPQDIRDEMWALVRHLNEQAFAWRTELPSERIEAVLQQQQQEDLPAWADPRVRMLQPRAA
ncbi:hypothetical protein V8J88_00995 [Massilia sp. W12]|uniref:hypothetical protein n=1 Tax=Massilia sp. W12 TaxID=3126507 RepID=UPI0030D4446F